MERIAIVSDIHGNIHALNVFMDYINQDCTVSKVLNLTAHIVQTVITITLVSSFLFLCLATFLFFKNRKKTNLL